MKEMRRVLALVLCLVMLIGIVPAAAFATESEAPAEESGYTDLGTKTAAEGNEQENPLPEEIQQLVGAPADAPALAADGETPIDAAIIFTDLHTSKSDYKGTTLTGVLTAINNDVKAMDSNLSISSVTSGGDAFSVNESSTKYTGLTKTITDSIHLVLPGVPVHYVWSDHDRYAVYEDGKTPLSNESGFVYGAGNDGEYGTADDGNYYIYSLSMADTSTDDRYQTNQLHSTTEVQTVIESFKAVAETLHQDRPLLVVAHQPLLDRRDDNGHALLWAEALNIVGEDMDVAYFFGHNHRHDVEADYFCEKGKTLSVCKDSAGNAENVKINFTHMSAGYLEPTSTKSYSETTRKGTAMAVLVYETGIRFVTYDSKGVYKGSYALDETVTREHAAPAVTLTSIAVTTEPTTVEYTVGDTFSAEGLVVTGTYSDGTTAPVTGYTLSEVDMTTAGEKEVTVTYEGKTATFTITVAAPEVEEPDVPKVTEQTFWSEDNYASVTATATGATLTDFMEDEAADALLSFWYGYDIALEGQVEGTSAEIAFWVDYEFMSQENFAIYRLNEDGVYEEVTGYSFIADEADEVYVIIPDAAAGRYIYGTPNTNDEIPADAVLGSLDLIVPEKLKYFDTDAVFNPELNSDVIYLEIAGMEVTAYYFRGEETYAKTLEWNQGGDVEDGYALSFVPLVPGEYGEKIVTVTYGDKTATFPIWVCPKNVPIEGETDVTLDFDTPSVMSMTVAKVADEAALATVNKLLEGLVTGALTVYDFAPTYANGDTKLTGTAAITLPIPEGVTNPVVYYVSNNGDIERMPTTVNEDDTLTFTTTHFSTFVVTQDGLTLAGKTEEVEGNSTTTYRDVWVRVETLEDGGEYIIANTMSTSVWGAAGYIYGQSNQVTPTSGTLTVDGSSSNQVYFEDNAVTGTVWTAIKAGDGWQFKNANDQYLGYTYTTSSGGNKNNRYTEYTYTPAANNATERTWIYQNNRLYMNLLYMDYSSVNREDEYSDFYLYCNYSSWSLSTSTDDMYFYKKVSAGTTTGTPDHTYSVEVSAKSGSAMAGVAVDLTSALKVDPSNAGSLNGWNVVYTVQSGEGKGNPAVIKEIRDTKAILSGTAGTAVVRATYTKDGMEVYNEFSVTAVAPDHYGIQLHRASMTLASGVTAGNFASGTYYFYNKTTGFYERATAYEADTTYYTTPVIQGAQIADGVPIVLKDIDAGDVFAVWAVVKAYATADATQGTDLGALGDALTWAVSDPDIATIDTHTGVIHFTGEKFGTFTITVSYKGADGITISDTIEISATETIYVVPGDGTNDFPEYPAQGSVRFDKTATAVGNYAETGLAQVELSFTGVPYTAPNRLDVVLMLDHSNSMTDTRMAATRAAVKVFVENIVINEDGTLNDNRIYIGSFAGGNPDYAGQSRHEFRINKITTAEQDGFQIIDTQDELDKLIGTKKADGTRNNNGTIDTVFVKPNNPPFGTEYDQSLEECYNILNASREDGNQQFCVFMSDGIPNVYRYGSGENEKTTSSSAMANLFTPTTGTTGNRYTSRGNNYRYEYWSSMMKQEGVAVFSVGLGLHGTNSSLNGANAAECERVANMLLNDISGPAGETAEMRDTGNAVSKLDSYFFSVADSNAAADMEDVFAKISETIRKSAKNVEVEDKVGNNYTISFGLPDNVTSEAADNMEEFYMQVVSYTLDEETHERTGAVEVLEKFTFDAETCAVKGHVVNGGADCGTGCTHVTYSGSVVTLIDGTYFDYKSTDDGEFINWTADEISEKELALQYFAYLDNSAGADPEDQVPAGTYYTNEYATLTYDNVYGNRVQQKFPVPQMTWNGAQVTYTFYLVNEMGQPVNRAGLVVPFAEALYVTDTFTYAVKWHDLEQSAGLYAKYLAEQLVPDVYALYDDDASYMIHVYEDEKLVNLNNHFVISGDVTDDYSTGKGWTNPNTTYVFNTKADAEKYTASGTYVADDSTTNTGGSYLCQSAPIVGATFHEEVDNGVTVYVVDSLGEGYKRVDGETQVTVAEIEAADGITTGGTIIGDYVYYVGHDENGEAYVYTIVRKNDAAEVRPGFDFGNTTVAFAVVWKPSLAPDTVVVDYGLDVVVNVLQNDNMAVSAVGVRTDKPTVDGKEVVMNSGGYTGKQDKDADVYIGDVQIGTAKVENLNSVRFSLDKDNGMKFTEPAVFYYEANVSYYETGKTEPTNTTMYSSLTVIPATTVYYEDEYVDLKTHTRVYTPATVADEAAFKAGTFYIYDETVKTYVKATAYDANASYFTAGSAYTPVDGWDVNSVAATQTQAVDRPGEDKMGGGYDSDNVYGYDPAYANSSTYSLGNAAKTQVVNGLNYATAQFEFYGTGFDVISLTSNKTGTIAVSVKGTTAVSGKVYSKNFVVDTYYGYVYENDEWVLTDSSNPNALYQIPVMKVSDLAYDKYTVTITASHAAIFDHEQYDGNRYDFYLDAIRIYDPCGDNNDTANGAYEKDGEFAPEYEELRNQIIDTGTFAGFFTEATIENGVFTENVTYYTKDAADRFTVIAANEEYNAETTYYTMIPGVSVEGAVYITSTFIDGKGTVANTDDYKNYGPNNEVYLAKGQAVATTLDVTSTVAHVYLGIKSVGGNASVEVYGIDANGKETPAVKEVLSTATDMYYDITNLIGKVVVIRNSGSEGIVSITNVKTAYEEGETKTRSGNEGGLTPNSVNAAAETEESMFTVDSETLKLALLSLSEPIKVEQPDAPEGGEPGGNEPGGEPEGGEPGGNEPGGEPEGGEPGGNEPGGEPEGGEPGGNEPSGEPEGGEPGGNEPGDEPEGGEPGGDAPQDPAPSEPVPEETEPEEKESVEETIQDIVEIIRDIIGIIGGMFRGWF